MQSFHLPYSGLFQSRYVLRQPQPSNLQFDWPEKTLEEIVGIPDILNEKLANNQALANIKKVKQNNDTRFSKRAVALYS
jgi:hypothetical protein